MSKVYIILALVLVILAGGLLFLPESGVKNELSPEDFYKSLNTSSRYLSPDYVAERLINEDPSIMLVDVRSPDQSVAFTLPGAVSIPIDEILLSDWEDYLNQEGMEVVLFSNGDVLADQAWILCTRKGYNNLFVLEGGLNAWFNDIMQPKPPAETDPSEAFDLYAFRKGARIHFSGGSLDMDTEVTSEEPVKVVKRKKKTITEGGC